MARYKNHHFTGDAETVIRVRDLEVGFHGTKVLKGINLEIKHGEVIGFVGASGGGKSVLTRSIIGLLPKWAGTIEVFGQDIDAISEQERQAIERRWGVLFQGGALFSSLTVRQNVQFPIRENLKLSKRLRDEIALAKLEMVGLHRDVLDKMPSELSGGMVKRVALARALALDPEILFLDEPTSGLDPIAAAAFDKLIVSLRDTLGLTVYMITHDLDSIFAVCDRVAVLAEGHIVRQGAPRDLVRDPGHSWVREYFCGERARLALA